MEENNVSYEVALKVIENGKEESKRILNNKAKLEKLLRDIEKKCESLPGWLQGLKYVPILASMVSDYYKKKYTVIPKGSILAVVSALTYLVVPGDLIPDILPGAGYLDDAAVILACVKLIKSDLDEYIEWRDKLLEQE